MRAIFASITSGERSGEAPRFVVAGLEALGSFKNHNYWGIASQQEDRGFKTQREVGYFKVGIDIPLSDMAIGHLRWAVMKGPTIHNTHPLDGCLVTPARRSRIVLAHNGTVSEVEKAHKPTLEKQGHHFNTDVASEALVHYIERQMQNQRLLNGHYQLDQQDAADQAFISGALEVFNFFGESGGTVVTAHGETLVAANLGTLPLVVARYSNSFLISSEPMALLDMYRRRDYDGFPDKGALIERGQTAVINRLELKVYATHSKTPLEYQIQPL